LGGFVFAALIIANTWISKEPGLSPVSRATLRDSINIEILFSDSVLLALDFVDFGAILHIPRTLVRSRPELSIMCPGAVLDLGIDFCRAPFTRQTDASVSLDQASCEAVLRFAH
jgi:hypothetical protein